MPAQGAEVCAGTQSTHEPHHIVIYMIYFERSLNNPLHLNLYYNDVCLKTPKQFFCAPVMPVIFVCFDATYSSSCKLVIQFMLAVWLV